MSLPFPPISPVSAAAAVSRPQPTRAPTARGAAAATETGTDAVTVDTMPTSPPPEVLEAIGAAARAYDRLAQSGRQLQFTVDQPTGRVNTAVTDTSGNVLGTLSGAQALAVADGEPLA